MSSRGRGYGGYGGRGGGSYNGRGSGYRGSYRGGGGRGSYEGRGGRGSSYSSYNSESRYTSSGNRYSSSRDRIDDGYKKPYRSEPSASYSSREYGGRSGSPDRKRMRLEGSSSERRSHEGGGHYGGSYSSRQESYGSERRSFGVEDRRRSPNRESYRKASGMGPPREPPRSSLRPRALTRGRPFRGRTMRPRGSFRARGSRGSFTSRRFERPLGYTHAFRTMKRSSSVKSKDEDASSTEEEWDADEKEIVEEKKEPKVKSPKVEPDVSEGEEEEVAAEGEDTDKEPDAASDPPPTRSRYIKLTCVHCKEKCSTFSVYARHLTLGKHRAAMSAVARRHKQQLLRMRVAQRGAQRELEAGDDAELAARTTFCLICRLNHRTTKHAHNLTDTHRAMKRFLMPFCRVCRISFRSPMIYEHHICSIDHIKRKANQTTRRPSPKPEGSGDEGMDVDLENFMTLDSVGDVDEVEDEESGGEKKEEAAAPKKVKTEINIGSEHMKKIEVWWCELCRRVLPRVAPGGAEEAEALRQHCRTRQHLGRYVQHRDTRTLRKQAERIHRQLHQQKDDEAGTEEATDKVKTEKSEPAEETKKKQENGTDAGNVLGEDKVWDDIGEFLQTVSPTAHEGSDDEEDLRRYDKFRKSDKKNKAGDGEENEANSVDNNTNEKSNVEVETAA